MAAKDGRRNARVVKQSWIEMRYIDSVSMQEELEAIARNRFTVYGCSGTETIGDIRIDWKPESNANLVMDFFEFIDKAKPGICDLLIIDPIYAAYNPNPDVWKEAIRKGQMPESVLQSKYLGHPNEWQRRCYEIIRPGGCVITKRNIQNCNTMAKRPTLWYVHDARPSAFIVRFDWK